MASANSLAWQIPWQTLGFPSTIHSVPPTERAFYLRFQLRQSAPTKPIPSESLSPRSHSNHDTSRPFCSRLWIPPAQPSPLSPSKMLAWSGESRDQTRSNVIKRDQTLIPRVLKQPFGGWMCVRQQCETTTCLNRGRSIQVSLLVDDRTNGCVEPVGRSAAWLVPPVRSGALAQCSWTREPAHDTRGGSK